MKITPDPRLVEAIPWVLFFRNDWTVGQIAEHCGGKLEDYLYLVDKLNELQRRTHAIRPRKRKKP